MSVINKTIVRYSVAVISVLLLLKYLIIPFIHNEMYPFPSPNESFYVYDEADVISEDVEELVLSVNHYFEDSHEQPQVVVATVNSLDGRTVEKYASELFDKWEIGNSTYDNGILLLISESDREVRIEVGYGLEGAITDSIAGRILDNNLSYLRNDNYSTAVSEIFTELVARVNQEYGYSNEHTLGHEVELSNPVPRSITDDFMFPFYIFGIGMFVFFNLLVAVPTYIGRKIKLNKRKKKLREELSISNPGRVYSNNDLIELIKEEDKKLENERYRKRAVSQLKNEKGRTSPISESMISSRMSSLRKSDAKSRSRRRSSGGGGGRSGGGGASRSF